MSFDMEPDHDEHVECRREIERLRRERDELKGRVLDVADENERLQATVEKLQRERQEASGIVQRHEGF